MKGSKTRGTTSVNSSTNPNLKPKHLSGNLKLVFIILANMLQWRIATEPHTHTHTHTHTHIYIYIYKLVLPLLEQDMTQDQFLSGVYQIKTQTFPSHRPVAIAKFKVLTLSYSLIIARERINGSIPFPMVLELCKMQKNIVLDLNLSSCVNFQRW